MISLVTARQKRWDRHLRAEHTLCSDDVMSGFQSIPAPPDAVSEPDSGGAGAARCSRLVAFSMLSPRRRHDDDRSHFLTQFPPESSESGGLPVIMAPPPSHKGEKSASARLKVMVHDRQTSRRRRRRNASPTLTDDSGTHGSETSLSPGEKLRRILKCILIIVEVCLELKRYVKANAKEEQLSLVEMQLKFQADINKKLPFNPHLYKAAYVANKGSSSKLKKLLDVAPEARTKRHVKMIHMLVQNKAAFSKHPIHIRLKLCQVMIYQSYEAGRVVIKQGHPPTAFYIILSGTCLINLKTNGENGEEKVETVNEIKEGEVFGEVALLNRTTRTASVICKDVVELLVIYQQDFDATVRGPLYKQREEVIDFCSRLHVLSAWPVKLLSGASFASFQYQYYRKGSLVVKNGLDSNFVVFVKSGVCRLVCVLDAGNNNNDDAACLNSSKNNETKCIVTPVKHGVHQPEPAKWSRRVRQDSIMGVVDHEHTPRYNASNGHVGAKFLRETKPSTAGPFDQVAKRRQSTFQPSFNNRIARIGNHDDSLQAISETNTLDRTAPDPVRNVRSSALGSLTVPNVRAAARMSIVQDTPYALSKPFLAKRMSSNAKLAQSPSPQHVLMPVSEDEVNHHQQHGARNLRSNAFVSLNVPTVRAAARMSIVQDTPYALSKPFLAKRMSSNAKLAQSLSPQHEMSQASDDNENCQEPAKPKFAQIAMLPAGCCFGLEEMMNRTNLKLTLMSDGAECVFVSRKLLLRHANGETMRRVNAAVGKYPTEDYIRAQLAEQVDWSRFREGVVKDVLDRREEIKHLLH